MNRKLTYLTIYGDLGGRRNHFATGGRLAELRVSYLPIGINLNLGEADHAPDERSNDPADRYARDNEPSEDPLSPRKATAAGGYDPTQPEEIWSWKT